MPKAQVKPAVTIPPSPLFEAFTGFKGVPAAFVPRLRKLVGPRYIDLLLHLPTSVQDRRTVKTIADANHDERCTIAGTVIEAKIPPRFSRRPANIALEDETGVIELVFFQHGPWFKDLFKIGNKLYVHGKVENFLTGKKIVHPEVFEASKHSLENVANLIPQYPLSAGLTHKVVAKATQSTLPLLKNLLDWLPADVTKRYQWPSFSTALASLHNNPDLKTLQPIHPARVRLAFDELLAQQLAMRLARKEIQTRAALPLKEDFLSQRVQEHLPFKLTADQQHALHDIFTDIALTKPMLRLVQGDVGAGKTIVAFLALARAVGNGQQGAMMAPTEILATQHYENAKKLLQPFDIRLGLLKGKMTAAEKRRLHNALAEGDIDIVFGTHALFQSKVEFKNLSLVVVDEQHRFGVHQRLSLMEKNPDHQPHTLVMTATPIPRTLALAAYGEMETSLIKEKPPGRTPIDTRVLAAEKLAEIARSLGRIIRMQEQVYWVCPLVEESEDSDLAAATQRFEDLNKLYPGQVGLLHGRMKPDEKDTIMAAFKSGEFKILVATTVIEVGVDVPQATTMVIEHAERFGLSQLHQLRGRVGRGALKSFCLLLYAGKLGQFAQERLDTLRKTEDGFLIAEKDLQLRGPGEILGTQQAGQVEFRVADLTQHKDLLPIAREMADALLANPTNRGALQNLLRIFNKDEASRLLRSG